jgi:hypothetical protein
MTSDKFDTVLNNLLNKCVHTLSKKAKEYSTEDRLHNFKTAAKLKNETPIQSLAGMMAKHTVSVYDMCMSGKAYSKELWEEKICDSINYLILLRALIEEE